MSLIYFLKIGVNSKQYSKYGWIGTYWSVFVWPVTTDRVTNTVLQHLTHTGCQGRDQAEACSSPSWWGPEKD